MRFALLGSGSEGNALVVQAGRTSVLLDCGFSLSETLARLTRIGLPPESLHGIVVTHEHGDHISGVAKLARRFSIPVWLSHGTLRAQSAAFAELSVTEIDIHDVFAIGDVQLQPYPVPHDAAEPVQFVFTDGAKRLGVLTDAGHVTPHIETTLSGCDALVLECNHDAGMLADGDYPWRLKQRVGGRFGHLNNEDAAGLLGRLDSSRLQHIVAAHLSSRNNLPELAVRALSVALGCEESWVAVATQAEGLDWREIG
ncbi:MAG: MBL fold metallo-hydrolase [Nitrosomonadales bacterium]|nr:MBL fold metallo-hydrolase [Nitrosomonadales bacterium]